METRERCSDVDWLHVIFLPQILCSHVDAGILFRTLNVSSLIPAFPCPSLKGHHWIKFPVQTGTEMLPSSKILFCLISWMSDYFAAAGFVGKTIGAQIAGTHSFADALNLHRFSLLLITWLEMQLFLWWAVAVIPPPFIQQNIFPLDFNHSSSLVQRIHCNLIISWDIRCCIN